MLAVRSSILKCSCLFTLWAPHSEHSSLFPLGCPLTNVEQYLSSVANILYLYLPPHEPKVVSYVLLCCIYSFPSCYMIHMFFVGVDMILAAGWLIIDCSSLPKLLCIFFILMYHWWRLIVVYFFCWLVILILLNALARFYPCCPQWSPLHNLLLYCSVYIFVFDTSIGSIDDKVVPNRSVVDCQWLIISSQTRCGDSSSFLFLIPSFVMIVVIFGRLRLVVNCCDVTMLFLAQIHFDSILTGDWTLNLE